MSGAEQTVVTDLDEAWREDVLQEAPDELFSGDSATLELVRGRFLVSESDLALMQLAQTVVTESDAKDIRGEILEGLDAGADGFAVDHPVFAPNLGPDQGKQIRLFQLIAKLGAEDLGERFDGHEKVFAGGAPTALSRQAAAGDEVMHMGMIEELAGPGVEHAHHAEAAAHEAWVLGQLQQGGRGSAKEQVIARLLL